MKAKRGKNDDDGDRFERRRYGAMRKQRMVSHDADDTDPEDAADYGLVEPSDAELKAIEEEGGNGKT